MLATMTVGMGSTKVATLGNICNLTNTYNLKTIYQIIETDSIWYIFYEEREAMYNAIKNEIQLNLGD